MNCWPHTWSLTQSQGRMKQLFATQTCKLSTHPEQNSAREKWQRRRERETVESGKAAKLKAKGDHSPRLCILSVRLCRLTDLWSIKDPFNLGVYCTLIPGLLAPSAFCSHTGKTETESAVYSVTEWTSCLLFYLNCRASQPQKQAQLAPYEPSTVRLMRGSLAEWGAIQASLCVALYVHIILSHSTGGSAAAD